MRNTATVLLYAIVSHMKLQMQQRGILMEVPSSIRPKLRRGRELAMWLVAED
jgi:hypothetical protein